MKGHIRERGAGNWDAVIDARDPATGKRKRKWVSLPGSTGKRQAQIECARLIAEAQNGGFSIEPVKTTVADYLDRWLEYVKASVSPRSHERYVEIVRKNIVPRLGTVKLAKLKPDLIASTYTEARAPRRQGRPFPAVGSLYAPAIKASAGARSPLAASRAQPRRRG